MNDNNSDLQAIRNFYPYNEMLSTAGQPEADQFRLIKQAGFQCVINLALPDSPYAVENEAELVEKLGLEYIHIPVDFKSPSLDKLEQFFQAMQKADQQTFVHCALNWRVSCFVYLYRTLKCTVEEEQARRDLYNIWQPDAVWENFMEKARSAYTS